MYLLYSTALLLYLLAAVPTVIYKRLRRGKAIGSIAHRLGRLPDALNVDHVRSIWIHAVSVGEVLSARPLLKGLRQRYPNHRLVLSTTTATGQEVARQLGDDLDGVFYAPLDLPLLVARSLDRVSPDLVVFVDTEIWPNWLRACQRRGVKTMIVNGRISDRSVRRYQLARPFMRRFLPDLDWVCAQTDVWGRRFVDLGFPPDRLSVTGSLKFDALDVVSTGSTLHVGDRALQYFSFATNRPVMLAASTLRGEEEPVLRAFRQILEISADAILILAPRHPERAAEVQKTTRSHRFESVLRTALSLETPPAANVVVLDTIGELPRLFQLATLVFVGGSLVPAGGHNILEPAVFGKPILFGPHMHNFGEIADLFVRHDAAWQVQTPAELERGIVTLFEDPVRRASLGAAARAVVDANKGARAKTLAAIAGLLPPEAAHDEGNEGHDGDLRTLRAVP